MHDLTIGQFLSELGSRSPSPGGGAVAAIVAALAVETGRMVIAWSQGREELSEHADALDDLFDHLQEESTALTLAADDDAIAYGHLSALMKVPKEDRDPQEWEEAVERAVEVPVDLIQACGAFLNQLQGLIGRSNPMLASDLAVAAILAEAAGQSAAWSVYANLPLFEDPEREAEMRTDLGKILDGMATTARDILESCRR